MDQIKQGAWELFHEFFSLPDITRHWNCETCYCQQSSTDQQTLTISITMKNRPNREAGTVRSSIKRAVV